MSKSLGNFFTIKDILKEFSPDVLRLFLISTHYRSPIDFSFERLKEAERSFSRLLNFIESRKIIEELPTSEEKSEELNIEGFRQEFESAMDDDFNTAKALGVLFELIKRVNQLKDRALREGRVTRKEKLSYRKAVEFVENALRTLGFKLEREPESGLEETLIELLIEVRNELRKKKEFNLADLIRNRLKELGIVLEDLPTGTVYKRL